MEEVTVIIPAMWADHHVMTVRRVLTHIEGVEEINISALHRRVTVTYDPALTDPEPMTEILALAGYRVGELPDIQHLANSKPEWARNGLRVAATNPVDSSMSGDFRKY